MSNVKIKTLHITNFYFHFVKIFILNKYFSYKQLNLIKIITIYTYYLKLKNSP